ncbi:MAG: RagB/SusD family nutrient uptake outer membrane protein [Prevotella sp.]|nr:RagB/SusD family nutrient uptake outer membrane protein [Prevotella sp.]
MKKHIMLTGVVIAAAFMLNSCGEDFLDKTPEGKYTAPTFYSSDKALLKGVEPLYNRAWFDFNRRAIVGMGSYRANDAWNPYVSSEFAKFQITGLTEDMGLAWSSIYNVVTMANATMENIKEYCSPEVSEDAKNQALGECYLMRGVAYFYLLRSWGEVILFEDNTDMTKHPVKPLNTEEDVLKFIIRDFRRAAELLPERGIDHHASKYAAKGMLAKALLAQSGWNKVDRDENTLREVINLCNDVINNGGYSLMEDYEQLFRSQNNDNSETLLAMKWASPNSGEWGAMNALYSDLCFSEVTDVNVWGGNLSASVDMIDIYNEEPADSFRLRGTFFTPGRHYNYLKAAEGGYTYNHNWIQCKKGVLGTKADCDGELAQMASPLNTYIQRLADVYLIKAEAILGNQSSTSDAEGLEAINAVRLRAHVKPVKSYDLSTLIRERRIEFCMEYFNWFDMVTWYRWRPQFMLNYFNNHQHRAYEYREGDVMVNNDGTFSYRCYPPGTNTWYFYDPNGNIYWNDCMRDEDKNVVQTAKQGYKFNLDSLSQAMVGYQPVVLGEHNIFMPYPEADVIQNPLLKEKPVAYDFGE